MLLKFTKMQGAGNDYIYLDCMEKPLDNYPELAVKLSDRHFGIGGDGLVAIEKSAAADAKMRMFNLDGSEGKMCGNAIRCVGKYLYDNKIVNKTSITVETLSGIKQLELSVKGGAVDSVKVDMGKAEFNPKNIPAALEGERIVDYPVEAGGRTYKITAVSMGNPHAVIVVDDVNAVEIEREGGYFERNPIFPEGVNTEFIQVIDKNHLKMRVWERGSGETLACGTGACASVAAAVSLGLVRAEEDVCVQLKGGELIIRYTEGAVYMTGKAVKVFAGEVEV